MYFFQQQTLKAFFSGGCPLHIQLLRGGSFGITAFIVALVFVKSPWFKASRIFFTGLVASIHPSFVHILFYSFCAGVGEEILFRGAVQPYLGIWFTSIVFIFLHGYLNPFNWPIMLYGFLMIFISAGLGYLFEIYGIYAAMLAHFIFDVGMFSFLRWNIGKE